MATRRFCDCGCGKELGTEHDAGRLPLMIQGPAGSVVQVTVHAGPGGPPMLRPECTRRIVAPEGTMSGALLFPQMPRATDPGAEEKDDRVVKMSAQRKTEGA